MKSVSQSEFESYQLGFKLYGDDFDLDKIIGWYNDEAEAYAKLCKESSDGYYYKYHELNIMHGYRWLPIDCIEKKVCAFGSAFGHEIEPIIDKIKSLDLIDSSDSFNCKTFSVKVDQFIKAQKSGAIPVPDGSYGIITCLGVLHHIPNVTFVMKELFRCLEEGGVLILREPISSMGDWRFPRKGLTVHERGIPTKILDAIIFETGFKVVKKTYCFFSPLIKILSVFKVNMGMSKWLVAVDAALSKAFVFNIKYHRSGLVDRFAPASCFYILKK